MSPDPRLNELLARWERGRSTGRPPTAEELCADAPHLLPRVAEEIRRRTFAETSAAAGHDETGSNRSPYDSPPVAPPSAVGSMRVIRVLGKGGMGWVLEAEDPKLRRRVAVKLMLPEVAARPTARQRFLREARAQAAIEHEHIVAIHAIDDDADPPYLVMPLLKGQSLAERLAAARGPLPLKDAFRIAAQMASGLAAAHAGGLIHRDVKPSNVWLEGEKGRVKLLDFGLALITGADDPRLTRTNDLIGTPAYMAPEQTAGSDVDHRADLFSLGCVMYEMTTGRRAFVGDSVMVVVANLLTHNPTRIRSLNQSVPRPLAELIEGLLEKNPDRRQPDTAAGVVARMKQMATDLSTAKMSALPPSAEGDPSLGGPPKSPVPRSATRPPKSPESAPKKTSDKRPAKPSPPVPLPPPPPVPAVERKRERPTPKPKPTPTPRSTGSSRLFPILVVIAAVLGVVALVVAVAVVLRSRTTQSAATTGQPSPEPPPGPSAGDPPPAGDPAPPQPPPSLSKWPFAAAAAKAAQDDWAKHLGLKVEEEIDLGGGVKLVLRLIPPGEYMMGSPEWEAGRDQVKEEQRKVVIPRPFFAGKFEVTQAQYEAVLKANPSKFQNVLGASNMPVEQVSWGAARDFCEKASELSGGKWRVRLPTEEEWEWLARGGTGTPFHTGRELTTDDARYDAGKPWEVGGAAPNALGLCDVHGNVAEWCWDQEAGKTQDQPVRGGDWADLLPTKCRSAARGHAPPVSASSDLGFRVIAEPVK